MTDEQKEKIIRFRSMGRGYADIGKELGISKDTVKSFCRRNSLTSARMRRGDKAAAEDEKAGVLLQSLQGKVVDGTPGEDQAESGL